MEHRVREGQSVHVDWLGRPSSFSDDQGEFSANASYFPIGGNWPGTGNLSLSSSMSALAIMRERISPGDIRVYRD